MIGHVPSNDSDDLATWFGPAPRQGREPMTGSRGTGTVDTVRIKVLGPLDVRTGGQSLELGGPQQRLVLAMLVANADAPVRTDGLIDALWRDKEPPSRARKTVQVYVANLRKVLGGEASPIESATGGYLLRTGDATVDAVDFEAAVGEVAREEDLYRTIERLSAALALWNGPAYADLDDAAALVPEITRLDELRLAALERRLEASLALGRHRDVLGELEALTTDHPYREGFTALHMLALYRSGRQAEALRAFQRTRLVLSEELGIDPSPQVRELEAAILAQDPSLDLTALPDAGAHASLDDRTGEHSIRGYELREQLDATDDGVLWRAYQPATGREVTLRIFGTDVANEPAFVRRFELDTQLVAQLEHPYLVSIYDFWRDPGGAYVVMPLLRGGTLAESLRRGPWNLSAALQMLDQIGSALAALHRHGVTHGRVGPDSVLLDDDGNAYLTTAGVTGRTERSASPPVTSSVGAMSTGSDVSDLAHVLLLTVAPGDLPADLAAVIGRVHEHQRVDDLLRSVRQATGSDTVGAASDAVEVDRPVRNPYKGLRAFRETDTADFFGRDDLIGRLVETVTERPLTAVVGPSGSGKSSVVKAGLMPAIRSGEVGGDWLIAEMFPGTFPFEELEAALLKVAVDRPDGLMADLTADDRGMLRVIKRVLPDDGTRLLLVIDQFEELFSLTQDKDTRRLFLDSLVTLGSDARSQVRTIVTLRADFFDRPLEHSEFSQLIQRGLVTVAMPDQDSLTQMVSRPARQSGLELEPGLVTEIVRDVMEQPGGLPLMQYALTELAERSDGRTLTAAGYRESGGVLGALGQRAEEIYQGLSPSTREVAERIFLRLVTVDEHADDTRRRIRRTELNALGLDRHAVETVLNQFGSFRLLSFDRDPTTRGPTVEVAHEALIREWPRLRSWIDDKREDLLLERRLREAVAEWNGSDRDPGYLLRGARLAQFETWADTAPSETTDDERLLIAESRALADTERETERRRVRRLRRLVVGTGVALVIAVVAGVLAVREQARSDAAAEDAELATLISRSAAQGAEDPEVSLLLALEAYQRERSAETEQAVLNALGSGANTNRVVTLEPLLDSSASCRDVSYSSQGTAETAVVDGRLIRRDLDTGELTDLGESPTQCPVWIADEASDRVAMEAVGGLSHWYGPWAGPWVEVTFDEPSFLLSRGFLPTDRLIYIIPGDDGDIVTLRDDRTGERVGAPVGDGTEGYFVGSGDATPDGSLIALGFAFEGAPEGNGRTFVINGETGEEIFHVDTPTPAASIAFDEARGRLVIATFDGTIRVIDLDTGAFTTEGVRISSTSDLLALDVRADDLVIAVSASQIEYVDTSTGPTGNPVELRDPEEARVRPDGTVLVVGTDGSVEIVDPNSNTLIEQTWDVDPRAHTAFKDGYAGSLSFPEVVPEVVDLATGARSTSGLLLPSGAKFPAVKIYPEPDGLWAFSDANVMARWEGDEMVEEIDLGGVHYTRTQMGNLIAVLSGFPDGSQTVHLVNVDRAARRVVFEIAVSGAAELHPSAAGGVHVIETDGTLSTYDDTGELIRAVETGVEQIGFIAVDPTTDTVALTASPRTLVIVDPESGAVQTVPDIGRISTLGFGRNGEILALTYFDGTVRLWDVERGEYAGLVWNGSGQGSTSSPSWYDETTESMWVSSSGKYLRIPLDPERWVERACEIVSRDLTEEEWDRFVPGDDLPRPACP